MAGGAGARARGCWRSTTALAAELGADPEALRDADGVAVLAGNARPRGRDAGRAGLRRATSSAATRRGSATAARCCSARSSTPAGRRRDLHLKGSGRTPFARGGDGKAAVGPMLREYVIGEAMHALGIPTSRALAVVATGERVARETLLPGAVLARVAASHLRVGHVPVRRRARRPDARCGAWPTTRSRATTRRRRGREPVPGLLDARRRRAGRADRAAGCSSASSTAS